MCVHAQMCIGVCKLIQEGGGELREVGTQPMDIWEQLSRQRAKSTGFPCGTLTLIWAV